jgi:lipoprotein
MIKLGRDYWSKLLLIGLIFGFVACGSKDEPSKEGDNTPSFPVTTDTTSVLVKKILSRTDLVVKVNRVTTEERYPGLVFSEIDFHTAKARQHAYVAEVARE